MQGNGGKGQLMLVGATAVGWAKSSAVVSPRGQSAQTILPTRKGRAHALCPPYNCGRDTRKRMAKASALQLPRAERSVRLDTLVRLRWLALIGQTTAVLVVYWGLGYQFPVWACLAIIALAAWLNIALRLRFPLTRWLEPERAAWLIAFDVAELTVLLFFTGGLENPFVLLFLGPVLVAAAALPARVTSMLAGFAIICATLLALLHGPLPWGNGEPPELPAAYVLGVWISLVLAMGFIGMHAW